jgi:hypothetical protein
MTTDFRALCAELLAALESWSPNGDAPLEEGAEAIAEAHLINCARTALAEPQPPVEGEVAEMVAWLEEAGRLTKERDLQVRYWRAASLLERLSTAQEELERERMRLAVCGVIAMADTPETAAKARDCLPEYWSASADDIARQIDKLMRLSPPQPTPVSERLPGPGDCDAEGMCWLWDGERRWVRQFRDAASSNTWTGSYWLPAHALPLP